MKKILLALLCIGLGLPASGASGLTLSNPQTNSNGVVSYDATSSYNGPGTTTLRVLAPTNPAGVSHRFIYVLPVSPDAEDQDLFGDGLEELRALNIHNLYNAHLIAPSFHAMPWYADHDSNPEVRYESFLVNDLVPWVQANLAVTGQEEHWLVGYSKSGFGAVTLLFRNPTVFSAAAAWDFPAEQPNTNDFDMLENYGTEANFQSNYRLTDAWIAAHKTPFQTATRLWLSHDFVTFFGTPTFLDEVDVFANRLQAQGVQFMRTGGAARTHSWTSGWLPEAVASLQEMRYTARDDFNRADGSLGPNWTADPLWGDGASIAGNQVVSSLSNGGALFWTAAAFSPDQFSQIRISGAIGDWVGVSVRGKISPAQGYWLVVRADGAHLYAFVSGTFYELVHDVTGWSTGDTLRLEVRTVAANTARLTVYRNGSTLFEHQDASHFIASGQPGIGLFATTAVSFDDWRGGEVNGAPVTPSVSNAHDDFNRPDGALGSNWSADPFFGSGAAVAGNQVASPPSGGGGFFWGANSFGADQYSQIRITGAIGDWTGVAVRAAPSQGYWLAVKGDGAYLYALVSGVFHEVVHDATGWSTGDTLRLEVRTVSTNTARLTVYRNGSALFEHDEASYFIASGQPGIGLFAGTTSALDDWEGGVLTIPSPTFTSTPINPTNTISATFSFTHTVPGVIFFCQLDAGAFNACSSPATYPGPLGQGSHAFSVKAQDVAGHQSAVASFTWTIDTTAPPIPTITATPPNPTGQTAATFSFTDTEPGVSFFCQLDAGAFSACSSPVTYPGPLSQGSHAFAVRAQDAAGNPSSAAGFAWTIATADTTPPETTITGGPATVTNATSATFSFVSNEAGSTFQCRLDAAAFAVCTSPRTLAGLAAGSHTFEVRAIDSASNIDPSPASFSWVIDRTAPDTTVTSGPASPTNSTNATFTFTSTETGSTFECRLDSAVFAACSTPLSYGSLASGSHTFRVRAMDAAGNVDASPAVYTWSIDTTAPNTSITGGPGPASNSSSATFTFSANQANSTFQCSLDGASPSSCASPVTYSNLAEGSHNFQVRATDPAGNADPTPASFGWTVDTAVPDTAIGSTPPSLSNSRSATFTFSSTEVGATFQCSLDGGSFTNCTSPRTYTGLLDGPHTFQVRARDAAGNMDQTPSSYGWTVDRTAPSASITSGPPTATNLTTASLTFTSNDPAATFQCRLDGGAFAPCVSPVNYSGLATGNHTLRVRAIDAAGNVSAIALYTWNVDTTPPNTTITANPGAVTTSTSATFTFTASQAGSAFACNLDGAGFAACASPSTYIGLTVGPHSFQVRATDPAGNTDPTPAVFGWTIQ
jgi:Putative esterase